MQLIKPYYEIITPINGEEILKQIELAARTCYKSEGKIEYGKEPNKFLNKVGLAELEDYKNYAKSARILIPKLISRGHEVMLEFGGNITVKFVVDRGVSHELVRHRLTSFAQESTRYCNYGKDEHITFIIPAWITDIENNTTSINITVPSDDVKQIWLRAMNRAEIDYNRLLKEGWSPQQARSVLPNSLKTEINVSTNIREWRHIFKFRTSNAAHPQMIEVMRPLLDEFKTRIPILFDDIKY